ncbi:MAG TPA: FmdB family zinc ribbon protein [Acidimicrobiales bacterium]|nr:FmdB family zinc ribbon protein [Acidimicrobiales bacterium]
MPTYEYSCKACGQHLEIVQSFKDSALTECPACGGTLRKVFGNIGIAFKGSGFYRTDSRSSGAKPAAKSAEAKSDGTGSTSTSTDKPASSSGPSSSDAKASSASAAS